MAPLPTESRIFANRYRRELKQREAKMANLVSSGTTHWLDAMQTFVERVDRAGSPIKRAALVKSLSRELNSTTKEGTHFMLACGGGNRSFGLMFATLSAGENPLMGIDEEGVNINQHYLYCQRGGNVLALCGSDLAFVSNHAIGRMHERGCDLDDNKATCLLSCIGALGLITRHSEKHANSGMSLHYGHTIVVGALRHTVRETIGLKRKIAETFFDVRTALPAIDIKNQEIIDQALHATVAVSNWLNHRGIDSELNSKLAADIPFLPKRDSDFFESRVVKITARSTTT